jgi:DNA-binding HxlR family transcriptional regulator
MDSNDGFRNRTADVDERNQAILVEMVNVLGKKWHPVLIYHLSRADELQFSDLRSRVPDITNKMLSDGLNTLEREGLVDRRIVESKPVRVRYSLTERGEAMVDVVEAMLRWGRRHFNDGDAAGNPTASSGDRGPTSGSAESERI